MPGMIEAIWFLFDLLAPKVGLVSVLDSAQRVSLLVKACV